MRTECTGDTQTVKHEAKELQLMMKCSIFVMLLSRPFQ